MRFVARDADPERARRLGDACGLAPATAQVLLHRGIEDADAARRFLEAPLEGLSAPDRMADRDVAAERLARAVRARERIAVFGDYDVDGTTSAAILGGVLEALGADVTIHVANRFEGGYGFSDPALDRVLGAHPSLIVTCDCGSSDHERIARAAARGVDTVVVDHHLVPEAPLPAVAFLNPHRPECGFPYKNLSSAGLALSLAAAVRRTLGVTLDLRPWLDLVALGTIADVVPLDGDNRRLVRAGLAWLASPRARPGIAALRERAGLRAGDALGAIDVAFRLTPRLNAAGRLGDPSLTLALLRARGAEEARDLSLQVERINADRKRIEQEVTRAAIEQVRTSYGEAPRDGVVAAAEGWHRGVVGISAARLVERFATPTAVVSIEGGFGHGSCRAPEGYDLYRILEACSAELERFGGHRAATGLSLRAERVEAFRAAFSDAVRAQEPARPSGPAGAVADVVVDGERFDLPPAGDLTRLEPLGEANPEPLFLLPDTRVESERLLRDDHLSLELSLGRRRLRAFAPAMGPRAPGAGRRIALLVALRPDSRRGGDAVELRVEDFEVVG